MNLPPQEIKRHSPKLIGVLHAPFQVATIPELHSTVLKKLIKDYEIVVVALPVRRITPSKVSPLDFRIRQNMILDEYDVTVVPVVDEKYVHNKIRALTDAIRAPFSNFSGADLYVDYNDPVQNHSNFNVLGSYRFLDNEKVTRRRILPQGLAADPATAFRQGIIYGLANQFPISWSTVDICIKRIVNGKTQILLGRKPGEDGWRFSGGFKDRADMDYETAVWREASEEVLKAGLNPKLALTRPKYIGSRNIDDWRYAGEIDGITTLFFEVTFIGNFEDIKAGDDLEDTQWWEIDEIKALPSIMEGEHLHLFNMLLES